MTARVGTVLEHDIGPTGLLAVRLHSSDLRIRAVDGSTVRVSDPTGSLEHSVAIERAPGACRFVPSAASARASGRWTSTSSRPAFRTRSVRRPVPSIRLAGPSAAAATLVGRSPRVVALRTLRSMSRAAPRSSIETASGDLSVDGLVGDQRYRTASGAIVLRDVSGQIAVDAVSGDVSIAAVGECAIGARTVSGDLHLQAEYGPQSPSLDDQRRHADRGPAGGRRAVRHRERERRHDPGTGRGHHGDRQVRDRRHPIGSQFHDRGKPRLAHRAGRGRRGPHDTPVHLRRPPARPAVRRRRRVAGDPVRPGATGGRRATGPTRAAVGPRDPGRAGGADDRHRTAGGRGSR